MPTGNALAIAAGLTSLLGLGLALFAMLRDPNRRNRRCPKCWYDLSAVNSLTCPECGFAAKNESQLFRRRRRWRLAALGIVIAAAPLLTCVVLLRGGPAACAPYLPSAVLIASADIDRVNAYGGPIEKELYNRIVADTLSGWECQLLIDRARTQRIDKQVVRARGMWPAGTPLYVSASPGLSLFFMTPWENQVRVRARLVATADGTPGQWFELGGPYLCDPQPIGVPARDGRAVEAEVELYTQKHRLWKGKESLGTKLTDQSPIVAAEPLEGRSVIDWLEPTLTHSSSGRGGMGLELKEFGREAVFGHYVAIGFQYTLFHSQRPVLKGWYAATPPLPRMCGNEPDYTTVWLDVPNEELSSAPDAWELELVGDSGVALLDYDRFGWGDSITRHQGQWAEPTEYWGGRMRVPLKITASPW